jgi:hypothetical protein
MRSTRSGRSSARRSAHAPPSELPSFDVARRFPLLAHFLARVGPQAAGPSNLLYTYLPVHLAEGMKRGEFVAMPTLAALDIIVGSGILVVARISAGDADDEYLHTCLLGLMRSLGYPSDRAEQLIANLLPSLVFSEESLLVRSHNRYTEQKRRRRTATPAHTRRRA